jgi:hypothetical protein
LGYQLVSKTDHTSVTSGETNTTKGWIRIDEKEMELLATLKATAVPLHATEALGGEEV